MRRITIADIARELNTTPATVSRALQNHPRIGEETKKRIVAYADRVGFKINKVASSLRSGKTHVIGVMIPSASINFFGSIVHGIETVANKEGYTILIYQSNDRRDNEAKGLEAFLSARVDGILVSIAKETRDFTHFEQVKNKKVPMVFFDRSEDSLGISSVVIDDFKGGYIATKHLIDQGYRHIAHITGPANIKVFYDRYRGYLQALIDHGIAPEERLVYYGDITINAGIQAVNFFHEKKYHLDAIFAVEDFTALGVIKQLKTLQIKIPEQVGVIGFANELLDEHITPTLSSIDQQTVTMGQESFKLILDLINAQKKDNLIPERKVTLEPLPVFRQSTDKNQLLNGLLL